MAKKGTRSAAKNPKLYRRKWTETSNPLVNEARAQTLAIQRIQVWLRLAYALLALAVLLSYWGFAEAKNTVVGVIGVVLALLVFAVVVVLRVGIDHGRKNVNAMIEHMKADS